MNSQLHIDKDISISFKQVTISLAISGILLYLGNVLKNNVFIILPLVLLYCIIYKKTDLYILFIILWLYISNFYSGQGWVSTEYYAQLIDARYYICFFSLLSIRRFSAHSNFDKNLRTWAIFYIVVAFLREFFLSKKFGIGLVIEPYYVYLYFIIKYVPTKNSFNNRLLNLLVAIGILQLIMSYMQLNSIIPPPFNYTSGNAIASNADDAAVGTMGSCASNMTSWLGTVLYSFFFTIGIFKKSPRVSVFSFIFLLQYATVDSKTLLGITVLVVILLLARLNQLKYLFSKNIFTIIAICLFTVSIYRLINTYYYEFSDEGIEAPKSLIISSIHVVIDNISEWGKIKGFFTTYHDLTAKGIPYIIWGDNSSVFDMDSSVRLADSVIMSQNNIMNSLSSFIYVFTRQGISALVMIIWYYYIYYSALRKDKFSTYSGKSITKSGPIITATSIIIMFIYIGLSFGDLPFTMIIMLYVLVVRVERDYNKQDKALAVNN